MDGLICGSINMHMGGKMGRWSDGWMEWNGMDG